MARIMVVIQQGRMKMVSYLNRMKTFHQFDDSSYFWREKTYDVVLEIDEDWDSAFFYTHKKLKELLEDKIKIQQQQ